MGRKRFSRYDNMPFSLWHRLLPSGRKVYYVRFKNEDGTYLTAVSSGQSIKDAAIRWAIQQITEGKVITKRNVRFNSYAEDFFNWDGPYVTFLKQRGRQIGRTHCRQMNSYLKNYLIPYFGSKKLSSFSTLDVEQWQDYLLNKNEKELSPRTINHMLICLRTVFKEAVRYGYTPENPCIGVSKLKENMKERGVLTVEETIKLFRDPNIWNDIRYYLICKTSSLTGMRLGELIALKRKYVHDYFIEVIYSWEAGYGLKDPKTKKSKRPVLITDKLSQELKDFMMDSPFQGDEDFVFYSHKKNLPITNNKGVNDSLYAALEKIGIKEENRISRNIVFHSLRHFFNTYMRNNGIPDNLIRDFLGHSTAVMTENYTHRFVEDFKGIKELQNNPGI